MSDPLIALGVAVALAGVPDLRAHQSGKVLNRLWRAEHDHHRLASDRAGARRGYRGSVAARSLHGASVLRGEDHSLSRSCACRTRCLRGRERRSEKGADVAQLRARDAGHQRSRLPAALRIDEVPASAAAQSAGFCRCPARSRLQYRGQFRHEYQLAVLRRRDDDEPSRADGGPRRAELSICRDRNRSGAGGHTCFRPQQRDDARKLLGRPYPSDAVRPVAAVDLRRTGICTFRRAADAFGERGSHDARRRQAGHRARSRCESGGDQAARHERRRLLQRQRFSSVREPERLVEHSVDLVDASHLDRLAVHVRPPRRRHAPGLWRFSPSCMRCS